MTNLSVPSVIFADASWYGSLRAGVEAGGGKDAKFVNGTSRWGIKGSNEISEGLSAVYQFESKVSTADASQPGGRLAYAGLSGGFGSLTMGQIWNAGYNHVGVITDKAAWYGDAHTGYRHGSAVSYAMSTGAVSFQLDAILDSGKDSGDAIDKLEFGMTIGLGDIGKVALAYMDTKDYMMSDPTLSHELVSGKVVSAGGGGTSTTTGGFDANITFDPTSKWARATLPGGLCYPKAGGAAAGGLQSQSTCEADTTMQWVPSPGATVPDTSMAWKLSETYTNNSLGITGVGIKQLMLTTADKKTVMTRVILVNESNTGTTAPTTAPDTANKLKSDAACLVPATAGGCVETRVYYTVGEDETTETQVAADAVIESVDVTLGGSTTAPATDLMLENTNIKAKSAPGMKEVKGSRDTHIAAEFSLGAVTAHLGYSQLKANGADDKVKVTHYGVTGDIGDTGINVLAAARSIDNPDDSTSSPWLVAVSKGLGGGATIRLGHANEDSFDGATSGKTRFELQVNF